MNKIIMPRDLEREVRGSLSVKPRLPLEGCPDDLRQGIINYWKGRGISISLLDKYYNFRGSLTINPSKEQIRSLYSH